MAQSGELVTPMCKYWLQFGSMHAFVFLSDLLLEELYMLAQGFFSFFVHTVFAKALKKKNQINMLVEAKLLAHSTFLPC